MVDIVKRVAKLTGKNTLDLRTVWESEVERALLRNRGEFDSRAFIMAAMNFLKKAGVTLPPVSSTYENSNGSTHY